MIDDKTLFVRLLVIGVFVNTIVFDGVVIN
jgi:hypothetical protein